MGSTAMQRAAAPFLPDFASTTTALMLANASSDKETITLTLYSVDGTAMRSEQLTLGPHQSRTIQPSREWATLNGYGPLGALTVDQDSTSTGMAVAGQLLITNNTSQTPTYLDEELSMLGDGMSFILEGVTDSSTGPPLVAVTNLAPHKQMVTLSCLTSDAPVFMQSREIAPRATDYVVACRSAQSETMSSFL
jgi:hypothetical protein